MQYSQSPPSAAVSECYPHLPANGEDLLLPDPVGAADQPPGRFSKHYASAASIFHHVFELLPWQHPNLSAVEDEVEEELHAEQQVPEMSKEQLEVEVVEGVEGVEMAVEVEA